MKPRAGWLTRFASWFFNTSPEWIQPTQKTSEPLKRPPSESRAGDAANDASNDASNEAANEAPDKPADRWRR